MLFRLPNLPGRREAPEPISEEFAGLVREAFPPATASEALRQRVALHTAQALAAAPAHPLVSPQNWGAEVAASRMRLALAGTLAGLLLLPLCSTRPGGAGLAFAATQPTPGQLAILDGAGQPLGFCPLRHTEVDARIAGYVARVTVKQEFRNPSSTPVEAIYTFPLPEDAAVDAMTMTLGADRIVQGEIKRREEAREIYEAARDAGQAAALLDQERPNIFTQSVANLMPGEKVTISISYVNTLKYEAGIYEFAFPMVVGPRFTGDSGGYTVWGLRGEPSPIRQFQGDPGTQPVVTDAEKITPPIALPSTRAGHDISLQVHVDSALPIQEVHSKLHPVEVERSCETQAQVRLKGERTLPNKDFILQYRVAGPELQTGVLAQADDHGGGHFTLVVQPPVTPVAEEPRAKEIVFVIDQSGSQSGWPIRKAKETMGYLVRNMNPGDTFQLLGFNTGINACFERPVSNRPGNVARALRFLDPIEGDGGTDILNAVDYAVRIPPDRNRRRIICYLTDGYVGDDMQILDYVRKHRGEAHMFPFGIGDAPNRFLISGMAREGHGTAEFVTLNSSAEAAAARFYRRISKPILTEVGVDWNGLPVEEVYPSRIPDLFVSGRPIVLKGRFTAPAQGDIILHGSLGGRPWRQAVPVSFGPGSDDGEALAALWAREKIEDLQSRDWLGQQTGNPNPAVVEKIVDVALKYGLMSQHTSFVAVEQRVVNLLGKPQVVDIPVELPEGMTFEGIFGGRAQAPRMDEPIDRAGKDVPGTVPADNADDSLGNDRSVVAGASSHLRGPTTVDGSILSMQPFLGSGQSVTPSRNSRPTDNVELRFRPAQTRTLYGYIGPYEQAPRSLLRPGPMPLAAGVWQQQQSQQLRPSWYYAPNQQGQSLPALNAAEQLPAPQEADLPVVGNTLRQTEPQRIAPPPTSNVAPIVLDPVGEAPAHRGSVEGGEGGQGRVGAPGRSNGEAYANAPVDDLSNLAARQGLQWINPDLGDLLLQNRSVPPLSRNMQATAANRSGIDKLAPSLRDAVLRAGRSLKATEGQFSGRWEGDRKVAVQLWIGALPGDGLQQLRDAGFEAVGVLRPHLVFLGTVRVADLEKLAALPFVLYLDPPKMR